MPYDLGKDLYYKGRRLPVIGDWISRTGQIYDIFATPCAPTNEIVVKAFFHGVPTLLWSLFKPDTMDLVFDRVGLPHRRSRKRRFRPLDQINSRIPVPKGIGTAIFPVAQAAEKLGWYLLVVDATTEFAVHWTSTAYQWSGCLTPGAPYCRSEAPESALIGGTGGEWRLFDFWGVQEQHIFSGDRNSIFSPGGYSVSAVMSMSVRPFNDSFAPISGASFQLRNIGTQHVLAESTAFSPSENHLQATFEWRDWSPFAGGGDFGVYYSASGGLGIAEGSTFALYGTRTRGILADP